VGRDFYKIGAQGGEGFFVDLRSMICLCRLTPISFLAGNPGPGPGLNRLSEAPPQLNQELALEADRRKDLDSQDVTHLRSYTLLPDKQPDREHMIPWIV